MDGAVFQEYPTMLYHVGWRSLSHPVGNRLALGKIVIWADGPDRANQHQLGRYEQNCKIGRIGRNRSVSEFTRGADKLRGPMRLRAESRRQGTARATAHRRGDHGQIEGSNTRSQM